MPTGLSPEIAALLNNSNRLLGLPGIPSALVAPPPLPAPRPIGPRAPGRLATFHGDPNSPVGVIVKNARRFGLDPAAVLAYALEESSGRWNAVGDQGSSFGPFQMHRGGALGSHTAAWAESPAGLIAGMQMMAGTPAKGLKGQAAVRAIYQYFGKGTPAAVPRGLARYGQAQQMIAHASALPPNQGRPQNVASQNPNTVNAMATLFGGVAARVIGVPYQGTHGRAFNARGGSDNWESENAVDFSVPIGTPVYALEDGTIGSQFGSLGAGGRFAGLRLHLIGANEWYYAHLSGFAPGLKPGTKVRKGQLLGYTGEANGVPHLHLASKAGHPPR